MFLPIIPWGCLILGPWYASTSGSIYYLDIIIWRVVWHPMLLCSVHAQSFLTDNSNVVYLSLKCAKSVKCFYNQNYFRGRQVFPFTLYWCQLVLNGLFSMVFVFWFCFLTICFIWLLYLPGSKVLLGLFLYFVMFSNKSYTYKTKITRVLT